MKQAKLKQRMARIAARKEIDPPWGNRPGSAQIERLAQDVVKWKVR